jgi:DNA-binding MarR family transcriptional regulator
MPTIRDTRGRGWYWIDNELLDNYGAIIGVTSLAVYNVLARRANERGQSWPGKADIMALTGLSKNAVTRALTKLERQGLISIKRRFDPVSKVWRSNVYTLLHIPEGRSLEDVVGQEKTQGRSLEDPGVGQEKTQGRSLEDPGVGQEKTEGRSFNDPEQDPRTRPIKQDPHNKTQQQQTATRNNLPAAALSILTQEGVDPALLNGNAQTVAAWIVYARTQKGIRNPAGYAISQMTKGEIPNAQYREIASTDLDLQTLIIEARNERYFRQGIQGAPEPCAETEHLSDDALQTIKNHLEGG